MSTWPSEPSPFVLDGPLPPGELAGRVEEAASLRAWARAGRPVSVYAPRRYGKSSLLGQVASDARDQDEIAAVVVDLYGVLSLGDLVTRLEQGYRRHLVGRARRVAARVLGASRLSVSLQGPGFAVQWERNPTLDPMPALHALLDLPRRLHEEGSARRVLVIFDEFQALSRIHHAEDIVRSHIQHHREAAAYMFAGSEPGLVQDMFADSRRAFYGQAEARRLGPLTNEELSPYIEARFEHTGRSPGEVLSGVLAEARGHPQRAMLLAHCLWEATPRGQAAGEGEFLAALKAARARAAVEHEVRWEGMSAHQQRVLRAVVHWGSPHTKAARIALGLPTGSVHKVVRQLVDAGILEAVDERLHPVDPLLERWLESRFHRLDVEVSDPEGRPAE